MSVTINVYCDDKNDIQGNAAGATMRSGAIDPGIETVRKLAMQISKKAKGDKEFAVLFRKNPNEVLAAYGLNEDIRRELILEAELSAKDCDFLSCLVTCWWTSIFAKNWYLEA